MLRAICIWTSFQFTPLREGRRVRRTHNAGSPRLFQFTPLREGRLMSCSSATWRKYFNSRPSARGDLYYPPFGVMQLISIHAPPRGATSSHPHAGARKEFQFTPLREGRRVVQRKRASGADFNSRPSARGDVLSSASAHQERISIHAPPRGATSIVIILSPTSFLFQFTPLREGRPDGAGAEMKYQRISIHAPPRGATFAEHTGR